MKTKPLWRSKPFTVALVAAGFTTIFKAMDNITVHNFVTAEDGLTAAFSYLIVGGWTGVVFGLVFALTMGKKLLDQDFNGLVVRNKTMHWQAIIAGVISAASTLFLLWGNQLGDPSMLIALGSGTIVYTSIYDVATKQAKAANLAPPVLLVLAGSILATFGGSLGVTLTGLLLVVVLSNGLDALSKISEQKGARASDGVNFFLWRFFWLALSGTIMAIVVSGIRGYSSMLQETVLQATRYVPFIALTMLFVFFGIGLKLVAMKKSAVSVVLIVLTAQIILGYPITMLGEYISPGLFGIVPKEPWIWGVRLAGAALIILAIEILRRQEAARKP
jgi:hypothetical protein